MLVALFTLFMYSVMEKLTCLLILKVSCFLNLAGSCYTSVAIFIAPQQSIGLFSRRRFGNSADGGLGSIILALALIGSLLCFCCCFPDNVHTCFNNNDIRKRSAFSFLRYFHVVICFYYAVMPRYMFTLPILCRYVVMSLMCTKLSFYYINKKILFPLAA